MRFQACFTTALKSRCFLPCVLAVAFLARAAILFVPLTQESDFQWYLGRAAEITAGQGYSIHGLQTAYWPVGWPAVLAGLFSLTGVSVLAAQFLNALMGTACCWLTGRLGELMSGTPEVGAVAALLIAVYPNQIAYVPLISTEVFYEFVLLGLLISMHADRRKPVTWLLVGAVFGLETLTKTQTLVLPAFLLIWIWIVRPNVFTLREFALRGVLIYVGLCCVVAPWTYRNWTIFHEFVPVSTNGGWTLVTGNNPEADGGYVADNSLSHDLLSDVHPSREVVRDRIFNERAVNWIKENPGRFLKLMPQKLIRMWTGDGEAEWMYQRGYPNYQRHELWFRLARILNQIFYVSLMLLALPTCLGLLRGNMRVSSRWAHTGIALFAYLSLLTVVFSGQSRFHFVFMPLVAIYAGWTVTRWVRRLDARHVSA